MSLFFDSLEHQRRLGARAVSAFSAGIALATVAAWATLHTSGLGAALAVAATVLMAVLSVSAEQSSTARMGQGVLLMAQVSLLVGAFSGNGLQIDMHMTYFAALGVLAIFADWTVILVAAATVAVHHLTLSFILPSLVFYGEAGLGRVLIHAVILIAEAATLMWTAANNVRMLDEVKTSLSEADRATADARRAQDMAENAIKAENASRQALDAERNVSQEKLTEVVGGLADGLSHLAAGDLTWRINQSFSPEFEALRTDFNAAMERLAATLSGVVEKASDLRSGAGDITRSADDLAARTERQAASLNETAAALEEVTVTVRATADGALRASRLVNDTRSEAEKSGQVVTEAVRAMSAIDQSSRQIGQIIGVIDEIAFQTNLLALNAGVEAARAGDAGRGFAVVASEVRALAQRSADAAKEIKALISDSSIHVAEGVDLVGRTGSALHAIVSKVAEVSDLVGTIAASAQEQASGLNQVNLAVTDMDSVTQQNAAMVEESTAASHRLSREAEAMGELVERFDLGRAASARQEPGRSRLAAPVRPRPTQAAPPPPRRSAAAPRGDARALQSKIADQWEEF